MNRIILIGYMASGKSKTGKILAKKLAVPFFDTDDLLEKVFNSTIAEYFNVHGEIAFRKEELKLISTYDFPESCVISTGGGLPCHNNTMTSLNQLGDTIYLKLPPPTIFDRLKNNRAKRPIVANLTDEELLTFIREQLEIRAPYYEAATYTISGINLNAEKIILLLDQPQRN